jgi:hypothetical protein
MLIVKESAGLHTSDECYKMAVTDALSVACKVLGMGASIYWFAGSKYQQNLVKENAPETERINDQQYDNLLSLAKEVSADMAKFCKYLKVAELDELPASLYAAAVKALEAKRGQP